MRGVGSRYLGRGSSEKRATAASGGGMAPAEETRVRAKLGCIPCIVRQAFNAACLSTEDVAVRREILNDVMKVLGESTLSLSPAQESMPAYKIAASLSGNADPYREQKSQFNRLLMDRYEELRGIVASAQDPLRAAVKLSIAGNRIDLGIAFAFDLDADLHRAQEMAFAVDDYERFARSVAEAGPVLFVADNAGEIVLDRLLIETLDSDDVTVAVRPAPVINDATLRDAEEVGLTDVAKVITTEYAGLGAPLTCVGDAFREAWERADMVISKGQANFETLDDADGNIFFLLTAKCDYVAEELGVSLGDIVLAHSSRLRSDG